MNLKYAFVTFIYYLQYQLTQCKPNSITYISTERPAVYWYDTKYFKNITMRSKRLNRQDPRYYVDLYIDVLITATNNIHLDFYFFQFSTNRYQPSFVEMHFKFCDMMHSDVFFGQTMRNAIGGRECPFSPGQYELKNLSIPYVPTGFPFTKGRIYCNGTFTERGVTRHVLRLSIDMEVKVAKMNKN